MEEVREEVKSVDYSNMEEVREESKEEVKSVDDEKDLLGDMAYFVIFPQNLTIINEAVEVIPNAIAKKAVIEAFNSVLIPVTKKQVDEARSNIEK